MKENEKKEKEMGGKGATRVMKVLVTAGRSGGQGRLLLVASRVLLASQA